MPNPKKQNNAPKGAYTDTNTDAPKMMMKKQKKAIADSAVGGATTGGAAQMTRKATPIAKSGNTSGGRAGNNPGQVSNRQIATPRTESIGTATATPRKTTGAVNAKSDPFLRGFNDDSDNRILGQRRGKRR